MLRAHGQSIALPSRFALRTAGNLSSAQAAKLVALYDELVKQFPKSPTVKRAPLLFLEAKSPDFRKRADDYLRNLIRSADRAADDESTH